MMTAEVITAADHWPSEPALCSVVVEPDLGVVEKERQASHVPVPKLLVDFEEWQLDGLAGSVAEVNVIVDSSAAHGAGVRGPHPP